MAKYLSSYTVPLALAFALFHSPATAQPVAEIQEKQSSLPTPKFTKTELDTARVYPEYFTINPKSIRVTLEATKEEADMSYVKLQERPPKENGGILVTIENIINIATKVWDIIKDNQPVANIETKYATAYPQGVTSATQLAGWSRPKSYVYGFYAENLYGSVMVNSKYKVTYTYNGAYKGKGKYLTAVTVIPTSTSVSWGYRFYMAADVPDSTIVNAGTDADPVAALQLKLAWTMASVLKEQRGTSVYYIQGDGYFEEIASPWNKDPKDIEAAKPLLGEVRWN